MLRLAFRSAWLAILASGVALSVSRGEDDDLAKELPRIPPTEPAAALKALETIPGFRVEPFATEPLVTDPVSACYDADGRLYVVEMRGYPYPEDVPTGNVRLLDDADHDGKADRSTIFLDGLSWPTSVVPYDGGVFVAVAPDIVYAKDTDGDGKADVKKVVFSGFGTKNVQQLVNGLVWGQDGWIYGATAGNAGDIINSAHPERKPVAVRGRDFRFKPDGSAFEAISGGGQFGHSFDDWGHRFVCNNRWHMRQIVLPARYLERNPALAVPSVIADIAADGNEAAVYRISPPEPWRVVRSRQYAAQSAADPVFARRLANAEKHAAGFFSSASGAMIYRGTAFPPEFRGNAFVCDVAGNLVHRKALARKGARYEARRADEGVEFLASPDNWFRPVNFANTPDGTLLVLDMYRETIEHPLSIPDDIKKHVDLTSGHDRGRLYHVVPDGFRRRPRPALSRATTAELVRTLADPDAWWRETAQRLLIERRDQGALPLLHRLAEERPNALGRLHALRTLDVLGGLEDREVLAALGDAEPGVREQAARLAEDRAKASPDLRRALLSLADDPEAMVRFQTALSIGEVADPAAVAALASIAVRDAGDPWTRAAVLSSVGGRTQPLTEALAAAPGFFDSSEGRDWLGELAAVVGATKRSEEIQAFVERFTTEATDPGRTRAALLGLGRGLQRTGGSLRAVLDGPAAGRLTPVMEKATMVAEGEGPAGERVEAVRLIALGGSEKTLQVLPPLLDAGQPIEVQLAALQALGDLADPRVGTAVIEHWRALSPTARGEAAELLLARPERTTALLDAVEAKALAGSDLDLARRRQLLASPRPEIRDRAEKLLGEPSRSDRAEAIAAYRGILDRRGDADRGRAVYRQTCATCHRAEGFGHEVGPDLATVAEKAPEDLLNHVLDPNREVAPAFVNYLVATKDGRIVSGLIAEETGISVTVKRAEGVVDVIPRARIEAMTATGLSLMPEGLEKTVSPDAMADLIAFLRGLRAPASPKPAQSR